VLGLKAVDRHDDLQSAQARPLGGDRTHRARDELRVDPALGETGQNRIELAEPHQRFAADDREMKRLVLIDQLEELVDQLLALVVANLTERDAAAEMLVVVCVATGAAQRTLASDFNRE
jgi:hypothetical protein